MKETRRKGTDQLHSVWKNLTSGINNKIKKDSSKNNTKDTGDMSEAHTPISRLDLTGMSRSQAKEMIGKIIDERLEEISRIELSELKIDQKERERERAKAAERINERRSRRRQHAAEHQTVITDQGIFANFRQNPVEETPAAEEIRMEEQSAEPIEGQLSLLDAIETEETSLEAEAQNALSIEAEAKSEPIIEAKAKPEPIIAAAAAEPEKEPEWVVANKAEDPIAAEEQIVAVLGGATAAVPDQIVEIATADAAENSAGAAPERESIEIDAVVSDKPAEIKDLSPSAAADESPYHSEGFDFFGLLQYDPDREGITEEEAEQLSGIKISTAIDEMVDRIFTACGRYKEKFLEATGRIHDKSASILNEKVKPVAAAATTRVGSRLMPILRKAEAVLKLREKWAALSAAFHIKESALSQRMARFVDFLDGKNEALIHLLVVLKEKIQRRADLIRNYAENHKKLLLAEFGAVMAVAAAITIMIGNMTAYEYIYNGKVLGTVKNQEDVYKTIDIIGNKLSTQYDADILIDKDKDIRFKKVVAFHQNIDNKDDILNRLTYMRDMKATGRGIYIEGKLAAVLESDDTAKAILQAVQDQYVKKDASIQYKKVGFAENVEIKDIETKLGNIQSKDTALEYIMTGAVEKKIHVVQSGETFSEIAKMYGLKQSELKVSNPDVVPEKLSIGQEICLNQIVPLVTVQTTEVAQYKTAIPFEIKYENTANLYKNEQTIKSKGTNGEKDVVAEIVRNNGIEVSRKELSVTVLSEPVSQVVLVGTKDPPPLIGTGTFIYPVRGTLSSRFGYRWGRLHSGIDLAAPIGTPIKAADGGKVTFSGYNGSLGYMVAIDHGGGRVTWYGHCSKLFVKKGDKVYQGQHIANVGNTGRSTGPHCHFEVHINGVAKNPLKYL